MGLEMPERVDVLNLEAADLELLEAIAGLAPAPPSLSIWV